LDESEKRKLINNLPGLFCLEEAWLYHSEEMKIFGNLQILKRYGIHQWSYPSWCRSLETRHLSKKGENRCFFEGLEAWDALKQSKSIWKRFSYLPHQGVLNDSEVHRCIMFDGIGVLFFIIKYGGVFEH
jgi:hypothetical protein